MTADVVQTMDAPRVSTPPQASFWPRIEGVLERIADRFNPILVKEARQALKSRQFVITFLLLLICAWGWTIFRVAMIGPEIYYGAQGPSLFIGYYVVLALPMFVIVPFGAYRSLVAEQEDRTWSLLVISTLTPRQIIAGKLGSAFLQMLIYLSSLAPCLAFTYLLRGIDLPSILMVIVYTVLGSLGLAMLALLVATITWERHWQVVLSVLMILGLFYATVGAVAAAVSIIEFGGGLNGKEFWIFNGILASAYLSYFALVFLAAAAQVTFATDNRSTRLRIVMLIQFTLLAGWCAWGVCQTPGRVDAELFGVFFTLSGLHWLVMGALMNGENPKLSPRVKRALPQSFLGRMFLTWFNPGPGTGYMFAICGAATSLLLGAIGMFFCLDAVRSYSGLPTQGSTWMVMGLLFLGYTVGYLGLGQLFIRILRRWVAVPLTLAFLLQILIVLLGCFVPLVIQMLTPSLRDSGYSLLQVTNIAWTLEYCSRATNIDAGTSAAVIVLLGAAVVFTLNLPAIVREVRQTRIAAPVRVQEEDAQIEAVKHPAVEMKLSPWD